MKKAITKGRAFILGLTALILVVGLVAWRSPEALGGVAESAFFGIAGLVGLYAGANVGDTWVKSKHFRPELADKEQS